MSRGERCFVPRITPSHPVPVRHQIAAGFECGIRDGLLTPGATLPPTRILAGRIGVHRNTVAAAYRLLRERRLVAADLGAPPRVPPRVVAVSAPAIRSGFVEPCQSRASVAGRLVREMMSRARAAGVSRGELAGHIPSWLGDGVAPRLWLVEPRPGLRAVLHAELQARLSAVIVSLGWRALRAELARTDLPRAEAAATDRRPRTVPALIVARPLVAERIEERFHGVHSIQPLRLGGGSGALADACAIRRPGVVALVTRSSLIRHFARELAAGQHGSGLSLARPDPQEPVALQRAARIARR